MRALALVALAVVAAAPDPAHQEADRILGTWYTAEDEAEVRIDLLDTGYAGTIVKLKEPNYPADDEEGMGGKRKVDRNNPDAARRTQPIVGLRIMEGFRYGGGDEWLDGSIYDPNNGKTYRCKMRLTADGRLKVRGYIGISLIGRTTEWRRAAATPAAG